MEDYPAFCSIGSSSNYEEAMNTILKRKPDIVFLNLDNVLDNAFQFVTELNTYLETLPKFVGISKTQALAYQAIKHNFIDYLIRPVLELDLRKLVLKFQKQNAVSCNKMLCLKSYNDYQYINIDEIMFLKADNNTTDFYINDGKVISAYKTLKIFENSLPKNFLRIHKSYIVNKDFISRINYSKFKCTVDRTSHKIPFTKTYIHNIEFIKESLSSLFSPN
jgi:DNA-binding LytR/AlgR family response regulator